MNVSYIYGLLLKICFHAAKPIYGHACLYCCNYQYFENKVIYFQALSNLVLSSFLLCFSENYLKHLFLVSHHFIQKFGNSFKSKKFNFKHLYLLKSFLDLIKNLLICLLSLNYSSRIHFFSYSF